MLGIIEDETRRLGLMHCGWRCDFGEGSKLLLHARSEGLGRKRTFAEAFARRRVVVLLTAWLKPRRMADGSPRPDPGRSAQPTASGGSGGPLAGHGRWRGCAGHHPCESGGNA